MRSAIAPPATWGQQIAGHAIDHAPALSFLAFALIMAAIIGRRIGKGQRHVR